MIYYCPLVPYINVALSELINKLEENTELLNKKYVLICYTGILNVFIKKKAHYYCYLTKFRVKYGRRNT